MPRKLTLFVFSPEPPTISGGITDSFDEVDIRPADHWGSEILNCAEDWVGVSSGQLLLEHPANEQPIEDVEENKPIWIVDKELESSSSLISRLPDAVARLVMRPEDAGLHLFPPGSISGSEPLTDTRQLLTASVLDQRGDRRLILESDPLRNWRAPALAPAGPKSETPWLNTQLKSFDPQRELPLVRNHVDAACVHAGLLQLFDRLDESHSWSQGIEGEGDHTGDYWHGIMHRREPDYGNSKYWFRRVGRHPIMDKVPQHADVMLACVQENLVDETRFNPMAFIDFVQHAEQSNKQDTIRLAEALQYREMLLLLMWSCGVRDVNPEN